jgi:SAM-dependent methyltransferase
MAEKTMDPVLENRNLWDCVVEPHSTSELYGVEAFLAGENKLGEVERREVGDVSGKRLLHPLCHFGLDSLSWARLGARVTGLDISPKAVAMAQELAERAALDAEFVVSDIRELRRAVSGSFDVVFMSWGAICWVPDLERLAGDIAALLAPGGFYYLIEGHPLVNALDEKWTPEQGPPSFPAPYSNSGRPVAWDWKDYADETFDAGGRKSYEWPHSNAQVASALAEAGLRIEFIHDHDFLVWEAAPGLERTDDGNWRWPVGTNPLPLSYSIRARKD